MTTTTTPTMKLIETPESNDVICGKDKTFNRNIGNMLYRQMIVATALQYSKITTKPEKMKITAHIVHTMIHTYHSRFLKQIMINGSDDEYYWQEISITAARDKTSHALRFCAAQLQQKNSQTMLHYDHDDFTSVTEQVEETVPVPITPNVVRRSRYGRAQNVSSRSNSERQISARTRINTTVRTSRKHRRTVSNEIPTAGPQPIVVPSYNYIAPGIENTTHAILPMECHSSMSGTTSYRTYEDLNDDILREPIQWDEEDVIDDIDCDNNQKINQRCYCL